MVALSATAALIAMLAPACAASPSPEGKAAHPSRPIDTRTPPGLRAQQAMDMLNSDWPIGPVGVGTLAAPAKVDEVDTTMEHLWWDRPFILAGVDVQASAATPTPVFPNAAVVSDDRGWYVAGNASRDRSRDTGLSCRANTKMGREVKMTL